jgi:hypothetical protein
MFIVDPAGSNVFNVFSPEPSLKETEWLGHTVSVIFDAALSLFSFFMSKLTKAPLEFSQREKGIARELEKGANLQGNELVEIAPGRKVKVARTFIRDCTSIEINGTSFKGTPAEIAIQATKHIFMLVEGNEDNLLDITHVLNQNGQILIKNAITKAFNSLNGESSPSYPFDFESRLAFKLEIFNSTIIVKVELSFDFNQAVDGKGTVVDCKPATYKGTATFNLTTDEVTTHVSVTPVPVEES